MTRLLLIPGLLCNESLWRGQIHGLEGAYLRITHGLVQKRTFVKKVLIKTSAIAEVLEVKRDSAKGLGHATADGRLWPRLKARLGTPIRELSLISAYFVPLAAGVRDLSELVRHGARVTVLTNSLTELVIKASP